MIDIGENPVDETVEQGETEVPPYSTVSETENSSVPTPPAVEMIDEEIGREVPAEPSDSHVATASTSSMVLAIVPTTSAGTADNTLETVLPVDTMRVEDSANTTIEELSSDDNMIADDTSSTVDRTASRMSESSCNCSMSEVLRLVRLMMDTLSQNSGRDRMQGR